MSDLSLEPSASFIYRLQL